MPRTPRALALVGLAALLLVVTALVALPPAPDVLVIPVVDVAEVVLSAVAGLFAHQASRGGDSRPRSGWRWLALACVCWSAGQAYWTVVELVLHLEPPFPSPADAGYLGMSVAATVGLWRLADRVESGRRALLDGLLVCAAVALVSWQTALGAVFRAGGEHWFPTAVSLAYPGGDIVLLTMTVLALAHDRRHRAMLVPLAAGLCCFAFADGGFAYLTAASTYSTGSVVDLGWCLGFALIGLAGLAAGRRAPGPAPAPGALAEVTGAALLPYVPVVVGAVVVAGRYVLGHGLDGTSLVLATVVIGLVMLRQYVTVLDNQRLAERVAQREAQLRHQAFHDALTGLANRALLSDLLTRAVERHASGAVTDLAVLFLDVDGFKGVNDSLGHRAGDDLLTQVAGRLRDGLRAADALARLGGDEFAVLLEDCEDPQAVAGNLLAELRRPFLLAGRTVPLSASIGLATTVTGQPSPAGDVLLQQADAAMYAVKRSGRNDFRVYSSDLRVDEGDDLSLHRALAEALRTGAVQVVFQPVVDTRTGRIRGHEALARWQHADRPVPPAVFVPVAERGGLVPALTDLVLERALTALAAWRREGHVDRYTAVNVSRLELAHTSLPARVADALARHDVPPSRLVLEITESGLTTDVEATRATLTALRDLGVRIALDDFGTGYNALVQLLLLPLDLVKIDRMFVQDVDAQPARQRLLEGLLAVASRLGLEVIAEGVETPGELEHLRRTGVPAAQGFLLGRPSPDGRLADPAATRSAAQQVVEVGGVLRR